MNGKRNATFGPRSCASCSTPAASHYRWDAAEAVFHGLTNKQIGDRLQISGSAVKACLQQLFAQIRVRTRSQWVRIALEQYRDPI
jgi:DNA-binding NarL/FixJ family response regulator